MTEEKKPDPQKKEEELTPQQKLDKLFAETVQKASQELSVLLNKHGLELRVTHGIQLVPRRRR